MRFKMALAVILNLVAVALPGIGLLAKYGQETRVQPSSVEHLLALFVVVMVAFSLSLLASVWLRRGDRPELLDFIKSVRGMANQGDSR
jgi:hypothetical protein